jgi:hypothetical protein
MPIVSAAHASDDMPQGPLSMIRAHASPTHQGARRATQIVGRPPREWLGVGVLLDPFGKDMLVKLALELGEACNRALTIRGEHPTSVSNDGDFGEYSLGVLREEAVGTRSLTCGEQPGSTIRCPSPLAGACLQLPGDV